ncbi:Sec-independent protein translocase protein TatB [Arcobacter sp. F2176]|uniref:Sec-independent protein translocase protein TatB n=1 Tax=Arcobacter sp. F2176 TaxID=2044511 RepID=UPI00100B73C1|nr:Sec-independent protein translocase protein TatB [Arcobacter sp. F2176]RXJ79166.1 twin-arginine translocase subunit TatB [Arcobacter sp. F2176]
MFGMGFMEIMLIAIIAIIALGPEKLPDAMVSVARFFKKFKSGLEDAKSTLDNELNISDMKEEANKFRNQIEDAKSSVTKFDDFDLGVKDILKDDKNDKDNKKSKKVSFKDEKVEDKIEEIKKVEEEDKETTSEIKPSDKFKIKKEIKEKEGDKA